MGTFYASCRVENHVDRKRSMRVAKVLVDTGSEYTWIPAAKLERIGVRREKKDLRFVMTNGQVVSRSVGFAILRVGQSLTIDEVVFAEPGDLRTPRGADPGRAEPCGGLCPQEVGGGRTSAGGIGGVGHRHQ